MKFPVPHDVKAQTIPGTEGWERMYPYQYQFVTDDPARSQYEKETFWFYDGLHYPEPLYPFGFGLSYTQFSYSALRVDANPIQIGRATTVSVSVEVSVELAVSPLVVKPKSAVGGTLGASLTATGLLTARVAPALSVTDSVTL